MAEHNKLLEQTADEVQRLRTKQKKAQDEMVEEDNKTLEKCREEKAKHQVDEGTIEKLMNGEYVLHSIAA